jgi:hypothetical protein
MKAAQIISHCCRFPPKEEEEMARHIILSVCGDWMKVYTFYTQVDIPGYGRGTIENLLISTIESEEETSNNFYWKIIS